MLTPLRGLGPFSSGGAPRNSLLVGLESRWEKDEASGTRFDAVGLNHLTDNNGVGQTSGVVGNAATFAKASTQWLEHADNASLSLNGTSWSFACYFKATAITNYQTIVSKFGPGGVSDREIVFFGDVNRRFTLDIYNTVGGFTELVTASFLYFLDAWAYVVVWLDLDAGTINIQVDNGTVYSTATTVTLGATGAPFRVGGNGAVGADFYMNGALDRLLFYRRALTSTERTYLFDHNGSPS